jgi:hypothetical protein
MSRIRRFGGRRSRLVILVGVLLLRASAALGQDVTEPALKAAFIYNFVQFTNWPADLLPATAPFVICVLGEAAVGDALERTVKGRGFAGHGINVSRVTVEGALRSCHLVYISGGTQKDAAAIVTVLAGAPVLTISDVRDFARRGGMADFFVENGKMRFNINLEAAKRARLQFSSKLLTLARLVHDDFTKIQH